VCLYVNLHLQLRVCYNVKSNNAQNSFACRATGCCHIMNDEVLMSVNSAAQPQLTRPYHRPVSSVAQPQLTRLYHRPVSSVAQPQLTRLYHRPPYNTSRERALLTKRRCAFHMQSTASRPKSEATFSLLIKRLTMRDITVPFLHSGNLLLI
jgi:hypothetical protein